MKRVLIESPYAGNVPVNLAYARRCMTDSLDRGEAPFASHLLYTQEGILDDTIPAQRKLGIAAGLAWGVVAELTAVYVDRGVSSGMIFGIKAALDLGRTVTIRSAISDGLVLRPIGAHPDLCGACLKPWENHRPAKGRTLAFPLPAEAAGFFECPVDR